MRTDIPHVWLAVWVVQIYLASEPKLLNVGGSEGPGGLYFKDCKPKAPSKEGEVRRMVHVVCM